MNKRQRDEGKLETVYYTQGVNCRGIVYPCMVDGLSKDHYKCITSDARVRYNLELVRSKKSKSPKKWPLKADYIVRCDHRQKCYWASQFLEARR